MTGRHMQGAHPIQSSFAGMGTLLVSRKLQYLLEEHFLQKALAVRELSSRASVASRGTRFPLTGWKTDLSPRS